MDECPTCHAPIEPDDYWCERCATRLVYPAATPPEPDPEPRPKPAPPQPPPREPRPPGPPPIPVLRRHSTPPYASFAPPSKPATKSLSRKASVALRIVLGFVIATIFVISAVAGDSEEEPPPLEPVIREQTVVARSGAYRTRAAVGSIEHVNADVAVTPALTMPAIVSTLHGPDGDFHITEIAFAPGPELPALESLGVERCRSRAVRAQHELSTVRGTPASTCHWTDGSSHDELFVVHADRILLFEYETTTDDRSPFTRMVDETRLYPANQ